jgi:hypothetical protein
MKAFLTSYLMSVIIQTTSLDQRGYDGFYVVLGWENKKGNRRPEKQICLGHVQENVDL